MLDFQKKLFQEFKDKQLCVLGFDREGVSTFKILRQIFPNKIIGISDNQKKPINDKKASLHFGKDYLKSLKKYDVIFRTPGIPINLVKKFTKKNVIITSQTKLFFDLCQGSIIGVTGTKGKSTTTTLIYKVLKIKFNNIFLIGNIGYPPLDYLKHIDKNSKIVFELSSHQLSDLQKSPHIAVFLNLFKEHMDYYSSFSQYIKAKESIIKFQTKNDLLIFNTSDALVNKMAKASQAKSISFSVKEKANIDCYFDKDAIYFKKEKFLSIKDSLLIGQFNLANIMPSIVIGRHFNIPKSNIIKAIKNFKPLNHRLEKVGKYSGIIFINDSLSTIPEATIAAINSLEGEIDSLIIGGFDRGIDQTSVAKAIINSSIPVVILLPDTGKKIKNLIKKKINRKIKLIEAKSMNQAVKYAYENTNIGKICLMSPAAASFNMFDSYQDRGNQFIKAIRRWGKINK